MAAVLDKTELPRIVGEALYTDPKKPWRWRLLEPVSVVLTNGKRITIPSGYVTDFASVPRLFWGLIATQGEQTLPALIHDYLYDTQFDVEGNWKADRRFADREFLYWLKVCGAGRLKRAIMFFAVRIGGRKWYIN